MTRITITVSEEEKNALCALAVNEFRDPRAQAAVIVRKELERQGFLPASDRISPAATTSRVKQCEKQ